MQVLAHRLYDLKLNPFELGECREQCSGMLGGYVSTICTEIHLCIDVCNPLIDIGDQSLSGGHPRDLG